MNSAPVKCPFEIGQAVRAGIGGPLMRIVAVYRGVVFLGVPQPDRYVVEWTVAGALKQANVAKEGLEAVDEPVEVFQSAAPCFG